MLTFGSKTLIPSGRRLGRGPRDLVLPKELARPLDGIRTLLLRIISNEDAIGLKPTIREGLGGFCGLSGSRRGLMLLLCSVGFGRFVDLSLDKLLYFSRAAFKRATRSSPFVMLPLVFVTLPPLTPGGVGRFSSFLTLLGAILTVKSGSRLLFLELKHCRLRKRSIQELCRRTISWLGTREN